MHTLVTDVPELVADSCRWWQIGKEYWQSDNVNGNTFEIRHMESGKYRWWWYADKSPDPEMPVALDDAATIAEALAEAHDYAVGHEYS